MNFHQRAGVTRADLLWLGLASGVSGALIGGLLLGLGLSLAADRQPIGLLILTPGAPVSGLTGWLLARRLAARLDRKGPDRDR